MVDLPVVLSHPSVDSGAYVRRWAEGLRSNGLVVEDLSIRRLVGRRRSVVHIHWPEHLVRSGPPHVVVARTVWTVVVFLLLLAQRNPLVWTAHNLSPHYGWRSIDRVIVWAFQRLMVGVVVTTESHVEMIKHEFPRLEDKVFERIPLLGLEPHPVGGRSADRGPGEPKPVSTSPRLLQFGSVAPYRGQRVVLDALRDELVSSRCTVTIVGRSTVPAYLSDLERTAAEVPGVTIIPRHVPDSELRRLMLEADAAIGVQLDGLNTGVLPAALPLGIPVISADTPQAREIRDAVGSDWVFLLPDLRDAMAWSRAVDWVASPREPISSKIFDLEENGRLHLEFYARLTAAR